MAKKDTTDILTQRIVKLVEQSAANSSSYEQLDFPFSIQAPNYLAVEILRVDVEVLTPDSPQISADYEQRFALSMKASVPTMDCGDAALLFYGVRGGRLAGTAANMFIYETPYTLLGYPNTVEGTVIAAPDRLFCLVQSGGMAAAMSVMFNIFYRYKSVTPQIALEMLQAINVLE